MAGDISSRAVVQLDLPAAWPGPIKQMVVEIAQGLHGPLESMEFGGDLFEREDEFRSLFSEWAVRAFHCTRLLEHEEERIRRRGLLLLTEVMVTERIDDAVARGAISRELGNELHRIHVFATREHDNREKMIWFFLSTYVLKNRVGSVGNLMRFWGGEAVSFSGRSPEYEPQLEALGKPAVVVVDLDMSVPATTHRASLLRAFVGRYLGEKDAGSSIRYSWDVPAEGIVDIWTPGHPKYDRFRGLPRE